MSAMQECGTILTRAATLRTLHEPSRRPPRRPEGRPAAAAAPGQGLRRPRRAAAARRRRGALARLRRARHARARAPAACPPSAGTRSPTGCWASRSPSEAVATRAFLDGSTAGRAWAHGVARELEPLAGDRLPELPAEARRAPARGRAEPAGRRGRERGRSAQPSAAEAAATTSAASRHPLRPGRSAGPRVSRRGGALLIGGALAAIARRRARHRPHRRRRRRQEGRQLGDPGRQDDLDPGPAAGPRAGQPHAAQGRPGKKAVAIVQFVDVNGQQAINAVTQGLPTSEEVAYGVWFYNSRRRPSSSAASTRPTTRATSSSRAQLPKDVDIASYKDLVVTRETPSDEPDQARARSTCAGDPERRRRLAPRQQLAGVHDPGRVAARALSARSAPRRARRPRPPATARGRGRPRGGG